MTYSQISYHLGKISGVALSGHHHNCGKGPAPNDCSRLDEIAMMLKDLALRLDEQPADELPT